MEEDYVPFVRPAGTRVPGGPTTASPGAVFRSSEQGQAVTSDMVALTGLIATGYHPDQLPLDKLPSTTTLLKPRSGVTQEWRDDFEEILASVHRSRVLAEGKPVAFDQLVYQLTTSGMRLTASAAQELYATIVHEWWSENTDLYHIVRKCIDLDGAFQHADRRHIRQNFWFGEYLHGVGLYLWATSFHDNTSVSAQASLLRAVQSAKLPSNANLDTFTVHCLTLYNNWSDLAGNDPTTPASFYLRLYESFPETSDDSKLGKLKMWLGERMADNHPMLLDPPQFITAFNSRAATIGLTTTGPIINALQGGPGRRQQGANKDKDDKNNETQQQ